MNWTDLSRDDMNMLRQLLLTKGHTAEHLSSGTHANHTRGVSVLVAMTSLITM